MVLHGSGKSEGLALELKSDKTHVSGASASAGLGGLPKR